MPIPANKTELLSAIKKHAQQVAGEFRRIPDDLARIQNMEGHTQHTLMSPHELASYLVGWGQLVLHWHRQSAQGLAVDFPATGYKWNELGALAQKFYADYAQHSYAEVLALLDQTVTDILTLIEAETDQNLYGQPWYRQYTLGRMIQLNTSSPYQNAYKRLRQWQRVSRR